MDELPDGPQWVCSECIGMDSFWQYSVGLIGVLACKVCGRSFSQPPLAFVSNGLYRLTLERMERESKRRIE